MQDYELLLRLGLRGKLANLEEPAVRYRVHQGQFSRNTSPYKRYTLEILKARHELARSLGTSPSVQGLNDVLWYGAQILRHAGVTQPRYFGSH